MSRDRVSERFKTRSREYRDHWTELAACQDTDMDLEGRVTKAQRALCDRCPVAQDCLREALDMELGLPLKNRFGIRGGLSPRERWVMQRFACIGCGGLVTVSEDGVLNRTCDTCREKRRAEAYAAYDQRHLEAS